MAGRTQRWRREGVTAGPANVLDGRFEVRPNRTGTRTTWSVFDRFFGEYVQGSSSDTMRQAKGKAERAALTADRNRRREVAG